MTSTSSLLLTTFSGSVTSRQTTSGMRLLPDFNFNNPSLTLFNSSKRLAHKIN